MTWNISSVTQDRNTITVNFVNVIGEDEVNSKSQTYTNSKDKQGKYELTDKEFLANTKREANNTLNGLNLDKSEDDITDKFRSVDA